MFLVGVRRHVLALSIASAVCLFGHSYLLGQDSKAKTDDQEAADSTKEQAKPAKDQAGQVDPLKRPLGDKERKANEKRFKQEVSGSYKKWLDEDVRWIITDEERSAFKQLSNDEERDQFIEAFWQRRDPTPDTIENEFKEEHYRRIAYANEHFPAGIPGWKTDRGRMYIMYGPADEIESHPSGGTYDRPMEEGGGTTSTYPFETVALPLHRGRRAGNHHRVRRHLHVRRLPHDDRPLREGRPAIHAQCRTHALRADGHVEQDGALPGRRSWSVWDKARSIRICRPSSSIGWSSLPS